MDDFFSASLKPWLLNNLSSKVITTNGWKWSVIFGVAVWSIWKERNNSIFRRQRQPTGSIVTTIKGMLTNIEHAKFAHTDQGSNEKRVQYVWWQYPPMNWIKLNVDGCSKDNPETAGAGGILRDHLGTGSKDFFLLIQVFVYWSRQNCGLLPLVWN